MGPNWKGARRDGFGTHPHHTGDNGPTCASNVGPGAVRHKPSRDCKTVLTAEYCYGALLSCDKVTLSSARLHNQSVSTLSWYHYHWRRILSLSVVLVGSGYAAPAALYSCKTNSSVISWKAFPAMLTKLNFRFIRLDIPFAKHASSSRMYSRKVVPRHRPIF